MKSISFRTRRALPRIILICLFCFQAAVSVIGQQGSRGISLHPATPTRIIKGEPRPSAPKSPIQQIAPNMPLLVEAFGRSLDANPITNPNAARVSLTVPANTSVRYDFQNGFVFPYFTTTYTRMFVSGSGYVTFGQAANDTQPSVLGLLLGPPRIAPFWGNLDPSVAGTVTVTQIGSDFLIVEWDGVEDVTVTTPESDSFALVLARNGAMQYLYGTVQSTAGIVGFGEGSNLFQNTFKIDFDQLQGAPNGINQSLPALFESFDTSNGADVRNSSVIFFNTDKLTAPGLQSILLPASLGFSHSAQTVLAQDPLGRFTKSALVNIDGTPTKFTFVNANQLSFSLPASFVATPGSHLVDLSFAPGVPYVTGLPLQVTADTQLISSVTPSAVQVNDSNVKVRIDGFGFQPGAKVLITDFARGLTKTVTPVISFSGTPASTTAFTSANSMTIVLPADFLTRQADLFFSVTNLGNRTAISSTDFRTHLMVVRSPLSVTPAK